MKTYFKPMFIACSICTLSVLSGCSWVKEWDSAAYYSRPVEANGASQQALVMQSDQGTWLAPVKSEAKPVLTDSLPQRIASLERSMSELQNDISMMMPALTRLSAAQADLQNIISQIQPSAGSPSGFDNDINAMNATGAADEYTLAMPLSAGQTQPIRQMPQMQAVPNTNPQPLAQYQPAATSAPVSTTAAASMNAPAPFRTGPSGPMVKQIRFGEHGSKTRVVLDMTKNSAFSYNVNNQEGLVVIHLDDAAWATRAQDMMATSPLVASYDARPAYNGGTDLVLKLKSNATVTWAEVLPPAIGKPDHRLVLDLVRL